MDSEGFAKYIDQILEDRGSAQFVAPDGDAWFIVRTRKGDDFLKVVRVAVAKAHQNAGRHMFMLTEVENGNAEAAGSASTVVMVGAASVGVILEQMEAPAARKSILEALEHISLVLEKYGHDPKDFGLHVNGAALH
jgi:hypothetical protein